MTADPSQLCWVKHAILCACCHCIGINHHVILIDETNRGLRSSSHRPDPDPNTGEHRVTADMAGWAGGARETGGGGAGV